MVWEDIELANTTDVESFDLDANGTSVSLALRQGQRLKVYEKLTDVAPVFDASIMGDYDLVRTARGLVLAVCNINTDRIVRTWLRQ